MKSKIIKDIANGSVELKVALKRAKVLLADFDNPDISNWISHELAGYPEDANLPDYRVTQGQLRGSYLKGSMATHMKYNDVSLPLGDMPEDVAKNLLQIRFTDGVDSLAYLLSGCEKEGNNIGKTLPADFYPVISKYNEDPFMCITSARVVVSSHFVRGILDEVENRLLDAMILLEREFGVLDELDIDCDEKSPEELNAIERQIVVNLYDNHSVTVGEGASIKNSAVQTHG